MDKATCPHCDKSFQYMSIRNRVLCPGCHFMVPVKVSEPVQEEPKPTKNERLLALREEIDAILEEGDEEDGTDD